MSWPAVSLGEVFEIARGGSPRPIDKYITDDPDGLNWVKIGDATASGKYILSTKEKIRKEGLSKTRAVEPGDFLLTNSMSFGRPYIMGTHGCIHDGWLVLKPRQDETVCQDYMYHVLGSNEIKAGFASRAPGSTVKNLNSKMVAETSIPLPPLEEQRRIAGILDAADALRRRRREALALLDTLPGAIFAEMFGAGENLDKALMKELIEVRSSLADPTLTANADLPHVGPEHILQGGGRIEWGRVQSCHEDGVTSGKYHFSVGDVIYSKIRPYLNKVAIADRSGMCSADMYALRPGSDRMTVRYLHFILSSAEFLAYGNRVSGRANIPKMNRKQLLAFEVPLPTAEQQKEFERRLDAIDIERNKHARQSSEIETLFASLQSRAFAGEL